MKLLAGAIALFFMVGATNVVASDNAELTTEKNQFPGTLVAHIHWEFLGCTHSAHDCQHKVQHTHHHPRFRWYKAPHHSGPCHHDHHHPYSCYGGY